MSPQQVPPPSGEFYLASNHADTEANSPRSILAHPREAIPNFSEVNIVRSGSSDSDPPPPYTVESQPSNSFGADGSSPSSQHPESGRQNHYEIFAELKAGFLEILEELNEKNLKKELARQDRELRRQEKERVRQEKKRVRQEKKRVRQEKERVRQEKERVASVSRKKWQVAQEMRVTVDMDHVSKEAERERIREIQKMAAQRGYGRSGLVNHYFARISNILGFDNNISGRYGS